MKVLLAGDVHGKAGWAKVLAKEAADQGCEWIVQLGDFGFWEHRGEGRVYLDRWEELLARYGLKLVFVPGNHENWPLLRKRYPADPETLWGEVRENLLWAERGARWEWDGLRFLALGGAYSIDAQWRVPGESWWPEELITVDDVTRAIAGGPCDVMLTHDCPAGVDVLGSHHSEDYLYFPQSELNRKHLLKVVKACRPRYLFHGHFHVRNNGAIDLPYELDGEMAWHHVQVEGFSRDGTYQDSYGVADLSRLSEVSWA